MANFESVALVNHPREVVFAATRDGIARAIRYVDDVERVVEERRAITADGIIEVQNTWYGKVPIPKVLEGMLSPHQLVWTDHAIWTNDDWTCRWRISSHYFPHHLRCNGATRFLSTSSVERTRVAIDGIIVVDPAAVPGAATVARWMEEFVSTLFPWSLRKVMDGVSRTIDEDKATRR